MWIQVAVAGNFDFEVQRDSDVYFEDIKAGQDLWGIGEHALTPELRQALDVMCDQITATVRAFMEDHRVELDRTRRRCRELCLDKGGDCLADIREELCPLNGCTAKVA